MWDRLVRHWVYGTLPAALLLFALTPVLASKWPGWLTAVWLLVPLYMVHQYEEFDDDRFLRFVKERIGNGKELLGPEGAFVLNVFGVWSIQAGSFALAAMVRPGLGLMGVYLVLVNAVVHVGAALVLRCYNPGLLTAVLGFVPLGCVAWREVERAGASGRDHVLGLAVAIGAHLVILAYSRVHLWRETRPQSRKATIR